jgi:hypothetical protein
VPMLQQLRNQRFANCSARPSYKNTHQPLLSTPSLNNPTGQHIH